MCRPEPPRLRLHHEQYFYRAALDSRYRPAYASPLGRANIRQRTAVSTEDVAQCGERLFFTDDRRVWRPHALPRLAAHATD